MGEDLLYENKELFEVNNLKFSLTIAKSTL